MASNAKLLRNITTSGGLFTENILLKLRDRPESQEIGKLDQFVTKDEIQALKKSRKIREEKVGSLEKQEKREYLKHQGLKLYEWGEREWEEIFPKIDVGKISPIDIQQKWLIPLFEGLDYSLEKYLSNVENFDEDSFLIDFEILTTTGVV